MRSSSTNGLTIIELIVVVGIIGVLLTLLANAVQIARESARRISCQSNARQLSMAIIQRIDQTRKLPENRFYSESRSELWIEECKGNLECSKNYEREESHTPQVLLCPSARPVVTIPTIASGLNDTLLKTGAQTVDYVVNAGVASVHKYGNERKPYPLRAGVAADIFAPLSKRSTSEIQGGYSNTLCVWEVAGSHVLKYYTETQSVFSQPWDEMPADVVVRCDPNPSQQVTLRGHPTSLKYTATSVGLMRGYISLYNIYFEPIQSSTMTAIHSYRVFNVTNRYHSPFSMHPQITNCGFLDGSVRSLQLDCDHEVAMALATVCADD
jgi:type II secretory pathway pseudopilin PulG